jgi:hypothetical protein
LDLKAFCYQLKTIYLNQGKAAKSFSFPPAFPNQKLEK